MRLIDADAFEKMLAEEEIEFPMIDDQPTVDAIPVEWLMDWNPREYEDVGYGVMRRIVDDWMAERKEK